MLLENKLLLLIGFGKKLKDFFIKPDMGYLTKKMLTFLKFDQVPSTLQQKHSIDIVYKFLVICHIYFTLSSFFAKQKFTLKYILPKYTNKIVNLSFLLKSDFFFKLRQTCFESKDSFNSCSIEMRSMRS